MTISSNATFSNSKTEIDTASFSAPASTYSYTRILGRRVAVLRPATFRLDSWHVSD